MNVFDSLLRNHKLKTTIKYVKNKRLFPINSIRVDGMLAKYNARSNIIYVNKNMYGNFSDKAILHEIGHAVDNKYKKLYFIKKNNDIRGIGEAEQFAENFRLKHEKRLRR